MKSSLNSGFLYLLKIKIEKGKLNAGDIILADKDFEINSILEHIGIKLNIESYWYAVSRQWRGIYQENCTWKNTCGKSD